MHETSIFKLSFKGTLRGHDVRVLLVHIEAYHALW